MVLFIVLVALATAGPPNPPLAVDTTPEEAQQILNGVQDPVAGAGGSFLFGQCTWLAARMRPDLGALVSGNAWNWANVAGVDTGSMPRVGAVAVYQPFVEGAGPIGHVAIVVRLFADGPYLEEGMNQPIFGQIAYRIAYPGSGVRFLYEKKGAPPAPAEPLPQPAGVPVAIPPPYLAPQLLVPIGSNTWNEWMVTVLSVIGQFTYGDQPDLIGIRVLVQNAKAQGARQMVVPLSMIGQWTYPDGPYDLMAIRLEVQRQKGLLGAN